MAPEDRSRLIRYLDFLADEMSDFERFSQVTWAEYTSDRDLRRNLERWIENLVNCAIDIAKVLLASEGQSIPGSYRETLRALDSLPSFGGDIGQTLSQWARLRNILAHEYLDVRWSHIDKFLRGAQPGYHELVDQAKSWASDHGPQDI